MPSNYLKKAGELMPCLYAFFVLLSSSLHADHHDGGRISWKRISGDKNVQVDFQITFKRLPNTPGGSGIDGYPRLNDSIQDPLSVGGESGPHPAPINNPPSTGGGPFTLLVIESIDGGTPYLAHYGENISDPYRMKVIQLLAGDVICIPESPIQVHLEQSRVYAARLYMWRRAEASVAGGEGLFNRPITMSVVETIIDLSKPGAHSSQNTPPSFTQILPAVVEFQASQILNDGGGNLTPGATLVPPSYLPFQIADADVASNDSQSDILTFEITNAVGDAVPGLSIDNSGQLSWDPAAIPSAKRKQTCGVWSVTLRVRDWAWDNPPSSPGATPKSQTELEFLLRINEPTSAAPELHLFDFSEGEYDAVNDPIEVYVPAGVLTAVAKYTITDPDTFSTLEGIVNGNPRFYFDPAGGCAPLSGKVVFAATLEDVGHDYTTTVKARDDDGHETGTRSFLIHVVEAASASLNVALKRFSPDEGDGFPPLPETIVFVPGQTYPSSIIFYIYGTRTTNEGISSLPLSLTSSWEYPQGTARSSSLPPGAEVIPALPLSSLPNPIAEFLWTPGVGDLGIHVIKFTVDDGHGNQASASVVIDVRAFTVSFVPSTADRGGGNIEVTAWREVLRVELVSINPAWQISLPSMPKGTLVTNNGTNNVSFQWRPMGVQSGAVSIPVLISGLTGGGTAQSAFHVKVLQTTVDWWNRDSGQQKPVIVGTNTQDFSPANQGQVKHVAAMAVLELRRALNGAGSTFLITEQQVQSLENVVQTFSQTENFALCNQGQLKNLAAVFYGIFHDSGVLFETNGQVTLPWSEAITDDRNYSPANIGQVKALFSFEPDYFYPQ